MKKFSLFMLALIATPLMLTSCLGSGDDIDTKWRDANLAFYTSESNKRDADGNLYYETVTASWDPSAQVLMHWFNDPSETAGNIKPLYSSTVDVKYRLQLYDGTAIDSSYLSTSPADSVFRATLNSGVIAGWPIAISRMHVGDSCRVVVPYSQGYGTSTYGNIQAYSTLVFDIKLVGVPYYEAKP